MAETTFKPTKLLWDKYIDYLVIEIINSNFSRRAENKPMATPKRANDSHITSRFIHELLVALFARKLSNEVNLNGDYALTGMIGHDAGHSFSGHEGEVILNIISRIYNTGYFHHNAKSVEVILEEDICNKAIDRIPDIENHPELRKQLQEEFYRFLDIVISHDGEATKADKDREIIEYSSYKEAVLTKLKLANSENQYKHVAQDLEGQLGKTSDVLAYLPTDILDGFRLGIITNFNDDYLETFGEMFSEEERLTKEEKIDKGEKELFACMKQSLRKKREDILKPSNQQILQYVDQSFEKAKTIAKEQGKKPYEVLTDEKFLNTELSELEEKLRSSEQSWDGETEQFIYAKLNKYKEFMTNLSHVSTEAAGAIARKMQQYFMNDIIQYSSKNGRLGLSPKAEKLWFRMKQLNYEYIVKHSRWEYQTKVLPEATKQLVQIIKMGLINSGTIRNMFYDDSIRETIEDEDALKCMKTIKRDESSYNDFMRQLHVPSSDDETERKYPTASRDIRRKMLLYDVIDSTTKKGEIFANIYMNVYNAIPYTVRDNVECALKNEINNKSYLIELQEESISKLRKEMILQYGSIDKARIPENKEKFIKTLIDKERENMEEKMAIQIAVNYLGGMTDQSLPELAIETEVISRDSIRNPERSETPSGNVLSLLSTLAKEAQSTESEKPHNGNSAVGLTGPNGSGEPR